LPGQESKVSEKKSKGARKQLEPGCREKSLIRARKAKRVRKEAEHSQSGKK